MKPFTKLRQSLLLAASLFVASIAIPAKTVIDAGFEKGLPRDALLSRLDTETDTSRAHSGKASLRISKKPNAEWGSIGFDLDGRMNFSESCEFSVWIYTEKKTKITAYISASDGAGRYTVVDATGTIVPGQWCEMKGMVPAGDLRKTDREFRVLVRAYGTCWVDDFSLVSGRMLDTPAQIWPRLKEVVQSRAVRRISSVNPGDNLVLDARSAALAPDTARVNFSLPDEASVTIPDEGMLVFAIDAKDDIDLTGSLQLEPDADLRPGLRVTVLANDTVIAAPSVEAAPWKGTSTGNRPGPAPNIKGERPSSIVPLAPFRLSKGRHYITIAGPHIRSGGTFSKLELQAAGRPAEKPLYTFGFLSDTHLGYGRSEWMNTKLTVRAGAELEAALRQLKREGADFAILAGDMTDGGSLSQFEDLARVIKRANLPVYGCIGNHDTFRNSHKDIAATIPKLFPSGPENTDYDFSQPPLRFIVLDGSHWRGNDGIVRSYRANNADTTTYRDDMLDWLRATLAKDTTTPTIVISHYQFYLNRGVSPVSGYDLGKDPWMDKKLMVALDAAPNVVATMNGHLHHNAVGSYHGITSIQNPAFVEWPNAYRVFRVYPDRMEWEIRQMSNRGLIRESVVKEKALLWMLSTSEGDLAGTVKLAPRAPITTVIDEGFEENVLPTNVLDYRVSRGIDTTRAHSGRSSLRVNTTGNAWGTVAFPIDQLMDFSADGEASLWIYAEPDARVTAYVSAQASGSKDRHTVAPLTGKLESGKWSQLKAKIPADYWRMDEKDVRLVIRTHGECWIDGVKMHAVRPSANN